ncbi:hypothetical protein M2282_004845 [Variovorax boronicumulans]|uniref:DUF4019 domain-containing protein n=1 Tax=Variovorax boronicumulans TaxID=436515 RepID=UPI00247401C0|nr:DUF4019 domain-containing protein [Variovorax boronicumulans]MDH6169676.1 hypothetical protein [Variovorax boronicumulans]
MKHFWTRWMAAGAIAMAACGVAAQGTESADALVNAALTAVAQIESGRAGDLWDEAAPFVKERFPKDRFAKDMTRSRESFGAVAQRTWAGITRIRQLDASADTPAGLYANVDLSTKLADGRTVFELVSFRQEGSIWRLTGYIPRQKQDQ